jgi:hypothetical protein
MAALRQRTGREAGVVERARQQDRQPVIAAEIELRRLKYNQGLGHSARLPSDAGAGS